MRCNLALMLTGALTLGLAAAAEARSANTVEVALTKCLDTTTATDYFEAVPQTTQLVPEGAKPVSAILEASACACIWAGSGAVDGHGNGSKTLGPTRGLRTSEGPMGG